jgi:hypothetical protein
MIWPEDWVKESIRASRGLSSTRTVAPQPPDVSSKLTEWIRDGLVFTINVNEQMEAIISGMDKGQRRLLEGGFLAPSGSSGEQDLLWNARGKEGTLYGSLRTWHGSDKGIESININNEPCSITISTKRDTEKQAKQWDGTVPWNETLETKEGWMLRGIDGNSDRLEVKEVKLPVDYPLTHKMCYVHLPVVFKIATRHSKGWYDQNANNRGRSFLVDGTKLSREQLVTSLKELIAGCPNVRNDYGSTVRQSPEPPRSDQPEALATFLRRELTRCWEPPIDVRAVNIPPVVTLRVMLNADGSLAGAPSVLNGSSDRLFQKVADAAIRGVRKCTPLKMPAPLKERYEEWKNLVI